ncbi:MAG TPA: hypothetical protein VG326_14410 [Tepidisphaeraceae bacterium]|jgi:hypothetical protein|nr:hypothetical protein [Tepidisphaeraceae bacterium]
MDALSELDSLAAVLGKWVRVACLLIAAGGVVGCQTPGPTVSNRALLSHLPGVDFSGLRPMQEVGPVAMSCSLPERWIALRLQTTPLYTHQQWKSPSGHTGMGVLYARLPMALSAKTLLWFAKLEYSKDGPDGKAVAQWTDALGRPWFEAENEKYHVRGYAVTDGLDAWIVYSGYKTRYSPDPSELSIAARSIDTVIPSTADKQPENSAVADGEKRQPPQAEKHLEG